MERGGHGHPARAETVETLNGMVGNKGKVCIQRLH